MLWRCLGMSVFERKIQLEEILIEVMFSTHVRNDRCDDVTFILYLADFRYSKQFTTRISCHVMSYLIVSYRIVSYRIISSKSSFKAMKYPNWSSTSATPRYSIGFLKTGSLGRVHLWLMDSLPPPESSCRGFPAVLAGFGAAMDWNASMGCRDSYRHDRNDMHLS